MKYLLAFTLLTLTGFSTQAQLAEKIWAEPAELKAMAKRTLVVELPEENPKVIEGFSKKTAEADIAAYRASLAAYRDLIEPAVRAHWKYNENIEFKTTSEIVQLFAQKSSKYVAMLKVVLADGGGVYGYTHGMGAPAIVITRTDGDGKVDKKGRLHLVKHDYQMYLVTRNLDDGAEMYSEAGMMFTLKQAQEHLAWIVKNDESKSYVKFCKDQAEVNCAKLGPKELLVDETGLYKSVDQNEARSSYSGKLAFVDRHTLDETYMKGDAEKAVLYSLPVGTAEGTMVVVTITAMVFMKVVVDPSTNQVLNAVIPGMGKTYVEGLTKMDFKELTDCD